LNYSAAISSLKKRYLNSMMSHQTLLTSFIEKCSVKPYCLISMI